MLIALHPVLVGIGQSEMNAALQSAQCEQSTDIACCIRIDITTNNTIIDEVRLSSTCRVVSQQPIPSSMHSTRYRPCSVE
jgi:hypothetical protein